MGKSDRVGGSEVARARALTCITPCPCSPALKLLESEERGGRVDLLWSILKALSINHELRLSAIERFYEKEHNAGEL